MRNITLMMMAAASIAAMSTVALAEPITITVQAPEGINIKVAASNAVTKDLKSVSGRWGGEYYVGTLSSIPAGTALFCARTSSKGWQVVFDDGASADHVCYPQSRMKQIVVDGKPAFLIVAKFQKQ